MSICLVFFNQACSKNTVSKSPIKDKAHKSTESNSSTTSSETQELLPNSQTSNAKMFNNDPDVQGSPAWIVKQYTEGSAVPPDLAKHFGVRLVLLKNSPSLGMIASHDSTLKIKTRQFYQTERRIAYQVGIGTQGQELQAYWIFQKIADLWIWTDLVQESPYYPWMKYKVEIEPSLSYMKGTLFDETNDPKMRLSQVIQRGLGSKETLSEYLQARRKSFLAMQAKLAAENRYSALLHNDSLVKPDRWKLWNKTGVYQWMKNESIERVQIESKEMILFFYATMPRLEQGLMFCGNMETCKQLQPDIQGYYYIEYENDPEVKGLDWVHFRGPKS